MAKDNCEKIWVAVRVQRGFVADVERIVTLRRPSYNTSVAATNEPDYDETGLSSVVLNRAVADVDYLIRKTLTMSAKEQKKEIEEAGEEPILSYNQTDFVKDRVAVEVQFGKYSFVAYDLFVKHLAFFVRDQIDVGIEILPMKSLQKHMSSGVAYYEGEFYNIVRQGRGVPSVPLVILGIDAQ